MQARRVEPQQIYPIDDAGGWMVVLLPRILNQTAENALDDDDEAQCSKSPPLRKFRHSSAAR